MAVGGGRSGWGEVAIRYISAPLSFLALGLSVTAASSPPAAPGRYGRHIRGSWEGPRRTATADERRRTATARRTDAPGSESRPQRRRPRRPPLRPPVWAAAREGERGAHEGGRSPTLHGLRPPMEMAWSGGEALSTAAAAALAGRERSGTSAGRGRPLRRDGGASSRRMLARCTVDAPRVLFSFLRNHAGS